MKEIHAFGPEVTQTQGNWDPDPLKREWYRHAETADRGYKVKRAARDAVRYDRPGQEVISYDLNKWKPEADEMAAFSIIQIAQVCFEADKKLCWAMGRPDLAKREWLDLTEKARKKWIDDGPTDPQRKKTYLAVKGSMA